MQKGEIELRMIFLLAMEPAMYCSDPERKALRVIPRGKQWLTVYRAHQVLRTRGSGDALAFRTKDEAEAELGEFFGQYLSEWHPSRNAQGDMTRRAFLSIYSTYYI